jgi:hypothetical protein
LNTIFTDLLVSLEIFFSRSITQSCEHHALLAYLSNLLSSNHKSSPDTCFHRLCLHQLTHRHDPKAPPKRASVAKPLQFVTVTSTKQKNRKDVSKVVRTQAMRDYFWKQRNPDSSEAAASDLPMDPSQYKGRFRLNSPPNSAKAKGAKKDKSRAKKTSQVQLARVQKGRPARDRGPLLDIRFYLTDGLLEKIPPTMLGATLDPFDSYKIDMKPEAMKLIWYCKWLPTPVLSMLPFLFCSISCFSLLSIRHLVSAWRYHMHMYCRIISLVYTACLIVSCLISSNLDVPIQISKVTSKSSSSSTSAAATPSSMPGKTALSSTPSCIWSP